MGNWCSDEPYRPPTPTEAITQLLLRIRLTCQMEQRRMAKGVQLQEDQLAVVMGQEVGRRSRMTEKAMIGRTVFAKNMLQISRIVEGEAYKLYQRRALLDLKESLSELIPSLNILCYYSEFHSECREDIVKLIDLVRKHFPEYSQPVDGDIPWLLMRHHRYTDQVTFEMENEFIMQFCLERGVELVRVNQVGHGYHYGATNFPSHP